MSSNIRVRISSHNQTSSASTSNDRDEGVMGLKGEISNLKSTLNEVLDVMKKMQARMDGNQPGEDGSDDDVYAGLDDFDSC